MYNALTIKKEDIMNTFGLLITNLKFNNSNRFILRHFLNIYR